MPVPQLSPVTRHRIGFLYLFEAPTPPRKGVIRSQKGRAEGFGVCAAASELAEGRGGGDGNGTHLLRSPEQAGGEKQHPAPPRAAWDTGASYLLPRTQKKPHYLGCGRWGLRRDEPPPGHRSPAVPPQDTDGSDSRAFTPKSSSLGSTTGWSEAEWGGRGGGAEAAAFHRISGGAAFFPPLLGCLRRGVGGTLPQLNAKLQEMELFFPPELLPTVGLATLPPERRGTWDEGKEEPDPKSDTGDHGATALRRRCPQPSPKTAPRTESLRRGRAGGVQPRVFFPPLRRVSAPSRRPPSKGSPAEGSGQHRR